MSLFSWSDDKNSYKKQVSREAERTQPINMLDEQQLREASHELLSKCLQFKFDKNGERHWERWIKLEDETERGRSCFHKDIQMPRSSEAPSLMMHSSSIRSIG